MSPGNEESAGKRIRSRTTKGNRWLRRALTEAAWASSHTKGSYRARISAAGAPPGQETRFWSRWGIRCWESFTTC